MPQMLRRNGARFVASRSLDYTRPDDWVAGAPETSLIFGTKVHSNEHYQLSAYRCHTCGYLEFYAPAN